MDYVSDNFGAAAATALLHNLRDTWLMMNVYKGVSLTSAQGAR